jgi:hypothetical protein
MAALVYEFLETPSLKKILQVAKGFFTPCTVTFIFAGVASN